MKKKTKTMMTTLGILGMCGAGVGAYMYMQNNKKKLKKALEKYMTYPEDMR